MANGSWMRLFLVWLGGLAFLFTGNYLLASWLGPPAHAAQSAFIALGTSTAFVLPIALARLTPVRERRPGQPGFATRDESWFCYLLLIEAAYGLVMAVIRAGPGVAHTRCHGSGGWPVAGWRHLDRPLPGWSSTLTVGRLITPAEQRSESPDEISSP